MIELYPRAHYVPAALSNTGGPLDRSRVRLFVVHIAQASFLRSIAAWFANPKAQVSSHFSVGIFGRVNQHVRLSTVAWAQQDYNDVAISIEHVGYSGRRLTRLQLRASMKLLRWLHEQFPEVPLHRTNQPGGFGVIGHGELGVAGGDHPDCPGTPVLYQFNIALRPRLA